MRKFEWNPFTLEGEAPASLRFWIAISQGGWKFFQDDSAEPTIQLADENVKPILVNSDIIRCRVVLRAIGTAGSAFTFSLQYSTDNVNFYDLDPTAEWDYADGKGTEGDSVTSWLVSDTNAFGWYYESDSLSKSFTIANTELDFSIKPTATVVPNSTYYFRLWSSGSEVPLYTAMEHPQVDVPPLDIFTYRGVPTWLEAPLWHINSFAFLSPNIFTSAIWIEVSEINYFDDPDWVEVVYPGRSPKVLLVFGGQLYAGCYEYIYVYDPIEVSWAQVGFPGIAGNTITSMIEFAGTIWIGTSPSGIVYYLSEGVWVSAGQLGAETSINSLAEDGALYGVGDLGTVYRYDGETTWTAISPDSIGQCLVFFDDGDLYGVYGDGSATKVWKSIWTEGGADWAQVGGDLEVLYDNVPRIVTYLGELYVSIQVSNILTKVYRWEDPNWVYVQYFDSGVTSLEVENDMIWAGLESGAIWSYGEAAGPATDPDPYDTEVGVTISHDCSWTAGAGAASHDVYFGDTITPDFIGNQPGTTYDPGVMEYYKTYYWRIDEVGTGTITGTLWSFTTESITVFMRHLKWFQDSLFKGCYLENR